MTPDAPAGRSGARSSLAVAAVVLALDQLTKHWALNALGNDRDRHLFWTFDLNLTFNSGMAFSRGRGIGPYIGVLALVVIVVMVLSLRRGNSRLNAVAVGLVIGGALGNIADRLFRGDGWLHGSVVDFIDPNWWPIFNVADIGVTVGGVLLVIGSMLETKRQAPHGTATVADADDEITDPRPDDRTDAP